MADDTSTHIRPPLSPSRRSYLTELVAVNPDDIEIEESSGECVHRFDDIKITVKDGPSRYALSKAASLLQKGETVAFPTETVYGLAGNAGSDDAVKRIFAAKARPADNPLIVHISSLAQLRRLLAAGKDTNAEDLIPAVYRPLIDKFWPGPLTILLRRGPDTPLSNNVTADQPTFAVRLPDNKIAQALCSLSDLPLAAPSANQSSKPSPTLASHVLYDLKGRIPLILDGGQSSVGLESTVVNGLVDPPVVLRPGGVSVEQIRSCGGIWERVVYGRTEADNTQGVPQAPGMKYKHYSPRAGVVLYEAGSKPPSMEEVCTSSRGKSVGMLRTRTWKSTYPEEVLEYSKGQIQVYDRFLGNDGAEISRNLFAELRSLDQTDVEVIYVEGIEETDEGLAVMNRLRKAASVCVRKLRYSD